MEGFLERQCPRLPVGGAARPTRNLFVLQKTSNQQGDAEPRRATQRPGAAVLSTHRSSQRFLIPVPAFSSL